MRSDSEAHHRAVVENAAEGILTISVDGTIGSFNAAAEAMFGWTASEIVGQPVAMLVPADSTTRSATSSRPTARPGTPRRSATKSSSRACAATAPISR